MVFMGTTKYPDENAFDVFNRKHGGHDNAHTDCETTVFYFETPRRHFAEGLERFAQFFIAPLMKLGSMQREREAVDSEFQMALPSDYDRVQQVIYLGIRIVTQNRTFLHIRQFFFNCWMFSFEG